MDDTPTPRPPLEDRLRSALVAGLEQVEAEVGPPRADLADLTRRRIDHHRRQRAGRVAVVAAVVVAAAVGGWALGRDGGAGHDVEEVADRPPAEGAAPGSDDSRAEDIFTEGSATTGPPATTAPATVGSDGLPIVYPQTPDPGTDSGGAARTFASAAGTSEGNSGGLWYHGMPLPTALAAARELGDGAEVRVSLNRYDPAVYELPSFWAPPAWCFPAGDVEVAIDDDTGGPSIVRGVRYDAVEDGTLSVRSAIVGTEAGPSRWVTIAQGPTGTARVRITYPGGQEDEVEPVEGVAVLSATVAEGTGRTLGPITAVAEAADGTELARHAGPRTQDPLGQPVADPPAARPACAVPTELPGPGPDQPADPGAAEAAVRAVWERVFERPGTATTDEQLAVVEDTRGVREALDRVLGGVSPEVLSETRIPIDDLVFADPERAYIRYRVEIPAGTYASLFGELVLVDGGWKVTRQTACDLAETGGGICTPLVDG